MYIDCILSAVIFLLLFCLLLVFSSSLVYSISNSSQNQPCWKYDGQTVTSAPALATKANGKIWLFARGLNGSIGYKQGNGTFWEHWTFIPGKISSAPAVSSDGNNIDVFARGPDNMSLVHTRLDNGKWTYWETLGRKYNETGGDVLASSPSVISLSNHTAMVFFTGTDDGHVQQLTAQLNKEGQHPSFTPRNLLGGHINSSPASILLNGTAISVFGKGDDDMLWEKNFNGSEWLPWKTYGIPIGSTPAIIQNTYGKLVIFAGGNDRSLNQIFWNGSKWISKPVGGILLGSSPAVISYSGYVLIYVMGTDGRLWSMTYTQNTSSNFLGTLEDSKPCSVHLMQR